MPATLELGQAKAKRLELSLGLPHGRQGSSHLRHHLLNPSRSLSVKLEQQSGDLNLDVLIGGAGIPSNILNAALSISSQIYFQNII